MAEKQDVIRETLMRGLGTGSLVLSAGLVVVPSSGMGYLAPEIPAHLGWLPVSASISDELSSKAYSEELIKKNESIVLNAEIKKAQEFIIEVFGINMGELAELCGVVRPTLYNWRANKPRRDKVRRLFDLNLAAKNWERRQYPNPQAILHEPILRGASLFDSLRKSPIDHEAIDFIGKRLSISG